MSGPAVEHTKATHITIAFPLRAGGPWLIDANDVWIGHCFDGKRTEQVVEACNSHASHILALAKAREALQDLIRAYVNTLESARDVIIGLGGDCDPVDMMERADPRLAKAKAALLSLPPQPTAPTTNGESK